MQKIKLYKIWFWNIIRINNNPFVKERNLIKLIEYIQRDSYKCDFEIPNFINGMNKCTNNLPVEDYDLDGGFVGRRSEIQKIKKYLYTSQDRIISITGAGGLGKTALALNSL